MRRTAAAALAVGVLAGCGVRTGYQDHRPELGPACRVTRGHAQTCGADVRRLRVEVGTALAAGCEWVDVERDTDGVRRVYGKDCGR